MSIQGGFSSRVVSPFGGRTTEPSCKSKNRTVDFGVQGESKSNPARQDEFVRSGNIGSAAFQGFFSEEYKRGVNEQRMTSFQTLLTGMIGKQCAEPEPLSGDGEYSADAVSARIMDMAKALAGTDKSKIDLLKKAVNDGFEAVKSNFGAELASVSQETYDLVMGSFYRWQQEE